MESTFDVRTKYCTYANCSFYTSTYDANGERYIGVVADLGDGPKPVMDITVNLGARTPEDCIAVKNYSENDGVLAEMQRIGLVTEVVDWVKSGFVKIPICRYDPDVLKRYGYVGQ